MISDLKSDHGKANALLLLVAAIWGFSFVAQRVGMQYVGPLTFNGVRFALGAVALVPLLWVGPRALRHPRGGFGGRGNRGPLLRAGLVAGLVLTCGATLQQYGVVLTTAGKAGFITGLYIIFVPFLGLFVGQRTGRLIWTGAVLAAAGLYLLSATGPLAIAPGDGLVLLGAIFWAVHVLWIGHVSNRVPVLPLALLQFMVCAILSLTGALIFETMVWTAIWSARVPIIYAGLLSVAVAYTLQVVAQRRAKPAHAAIILSFEAVFAAVGGWWVLSESMSGRGLAGCGLMLAGVLLAQMSSVAPKNPEET